jgi:hypothetical protein
MLWQGVFQHVNDLKGGLTALLVIVVLTVLLQSLFRYFSTSARFRGLPLPPGPPRKWIIGNLLQMPKGDFVTQTTKWAKEYGKSNKNFE